jgi:hypothetical protein
VSIVLYFAHQCIKSFLFLWFKVNIGHGKACLVRLASIIVIAIVILINRRIGAIINHLIDYFSVKNSWTWVLKRAVHLIPCGWIFGCALDLVDIAILCVILIAYNDVLLAKLLFPWAAFLIVLLDLEVLITVKFHEFSVSISSLSIVRIPWRHFVGPPRHPFRNFLLAAHKLIEKLIHELAYILFTSNLIFLFYPFHCDFTWSNDILFDDFECLLLLPFLDLIRVDFLRICDILAHQNHEGLVRIPVAWLKSIGDFDPRFLGRFHQVHDYISRSNIRRLKFLFFIFLGISH